MKAYNVELTLCQPGILALRLRDRSGEGMQKICVRHSERAGSLLNNPRHKHRVPKRRPPQRNDKARLLDKALPRCGNAALPVCCGAVGGGGVQFFWKKNRQPCRVKFGCALYSSNAAASETESTGTETVFIFVPLPPFPFNLISEMTGVIVSVMSCASICVK